MIANCISDTGANVESEKRAKHDCSSKVPKAMHAHGKVRYKHNGCEIIVVPGTDKIKVELTDTEESEAAPF